MPRVTPDGGLGLVLRGQMSHPHDTAILGVQTGKMPLRPQHVDQSVVDRRCAARAASVRDAIRTVVRVHPKRFARGGLDAVDPLLAGEAVSRTRVVGHFAGRLLVVGQIHTPVDDGRSGIAPRHGDSPLHRQPTLRNGIDHPRLVPLAVAVRPHPLRPIRSEGRRTGPHRRPRAEHARENPHPAGNVSHHALLAVPWKSECPPPKSSATHSTPAMRP